MFRIKLRGWPLWALLSVLGFCAVASTVYAIWPQRCETVSELRVQPDATASTRLVRTAAPTRTDQTKSGTSREGNGQVRTGTILMFQ